MWLIAVVLGATGWSLKDNDRVVWISTILLLFAGIFAFFAFIATVDWITNRSITRLREYEAARTWGTVHVAEAVSRLTTGRQLEMVEQYGIVGIEMAIGDAAPLFFVRTPSGTVPWDTVEDFLRQSQDTDPLLLPVRRGGLPWREAQAITALIIAHGWAARTSKNDVARLTKPLAWVAGRFGVDLALPELGSEE